MQNVHLHFWIILNCLHINSCSCTTWLHDERHVPLNYFLIWMSFNACSIKGKNGKILVVQLSGKTLSGSPDPHSHSLAKNSSQILGFRFLTKCFFTPEDLVAIYISQIRPTLKLIIKPVSTFSTKAQIRIHQSIL